MPGCYHQSGVANGSPARGTSAAPTFPDTPDHSPVHPDAGTLARSVRSRHPAAQTRICWICAESPPSRTHNCPDA